MIICVACGFLLAFAVNRPDFAVRGLSLAVPIILSSFFLSKIYKEKFEISSSLNILVLSQRTTTLLFGILYNVSLLILAISSFRPFYYFIIMLILYSIVFIQILSKNTSTVILLSEMVFLMVNAIYGITLKYPLYFGWTDILGHLILSKVMYLSGHIIPSDLSFYNSSFPLYHILITESSYLLGLDLSTSLFLIAAPFYSILILFIYKYFNLISSNSQIALLTCLIYSSISTVLFYGAYMITRTVAFIGFFILLYLIYKGYSKRNTTIYRALSIIISFFIILVHQVSITQIVILLFVLFICERIINNKTYLSKNFILFLNVLFIGYWLFFAYSFVQDLLQFRAKPEFYETFAVKSTVQAGNEWIFLSDNIDTSIFLFFALIGIGYVLWKENKKYSSVVGLFALSTLVLYTPNPLQLLWQSMVLFRFDRFMLLLSPFMAFVMGVGIYVFFSYMLYKNLNKKTALAILLILFSIFSFNSIIENAEDSHYFKSDIERKYFNNEELTGFNHIFNHVSFGSNLYSDYHVQRFFSYREFSKSEALNFPYYDNNEITTVDSISGYKGYTLIRYNKFLDTGLRFTDGLYTSTGKNQVHLLTNLTNNKIYSNHAIYIYYN